MGFSSLSRCRLYSARRIIVRMDLYTRKHLPMTDAIIQQLTFDSAAAALSGSYNRGKDKGLFFFCLIVSCYFHIIPSNNILYSPLSAVTEFNPICQSIIHRTEPRRKRELYFPSLHLSRSCLIWFVLFVCLFCFSLHVAAFFFNFSSLYLLYGER